MSVAEGKRERVRLVHGSMCRFPFLMKLTKRHVIVQYGEGSPNPGMIEKYRLKDGSCVGRAKHYANYHLNTVDLDKWRTRAEELP